MERSFEQAVVTSELETAMLATENTDHVANCLGVKVPASPFMHAKRIERINAARYEGQEIAGALHVVESTDRVLEMGAGLGIVGAVVARNAKPQEILSFEANPNLIPHIEALYRLNRLDGRITVRNEVLIAQKDRPATMTFHLGSSYLGSSLIRDGSPKTDAVDVPTADFNSVLKDFRATVLLMDIEGGELDVLRDADLTGLRAMVLEFHPDAYGIEGMRECKRILRRAGFDRVESHSSRTVWVCTRNQEAMANAA